MQLEINMYFKDFTYLTTNLVLHCTVVILLILY